MKQIPVIESLRAIAAWSVCLYHFICTVIGFVHSETLHNLFSFGQYGVHVFFVISGFIIPWSMFHAGYELKSMFRFILKRIVRLDPPYICSILLALGIIYYKVYSGYSTETSQAITLKGVLLHLGYLVNFFPDYHWLNNVYWTLAIEFQYYILMALLYFLFVSPMPGKRFLAYGICFTGSFLLLNYRTHFPVYAPLFLVGISIFQYKTKVIPQLELVLLLAVITVYNFFALGPVITLIGLSAGLCILFFEQVRIPLLHWLGKFSYSVYLVHCILGVAILNIMAHRPLSLLQKSGVLLLGILITFMASLLMYYLVEKPSKKLSSKIRFR